MHSFVKEILDYMDEGFTGLKIRDAPYNLIYHDGGLYVSRNTTTVREFLYTNSIKHAPMSEIEKMFIDIGAHQASKYFNEKFEILIWDDTEVLRLIKETAF